LCVRACVCEDMLQSPYADNLKRIAGVFYLCVGRPNIISTEDDLWHQCPQQTHSSNELVELFVSKPHVRYMLSSWPPSSSNCGECRTLDFRMTL